LIISKSMTGNAKKELIDVVLDLVWSGSYESTTIAQICQKAGISKGSFCYFFDSKSDLVAKAFKIHWKIKRTELDSIFASIVSPLERLHKFFRQEYTFQCEIKAKHGHVLGSPEITVGSEICIREITLNKTIREIVSQKYRYIESAINDAKVAGEIHVTNCGVNARILVAYYEGLLIRARIQDDLEVLREIDNGMLTILELKQNTAI
jgi:TetR/AcrR family transcriptional regulator, transcriptional repressor for nem operon